MMVNPMMAAKHDEEKHVNLGMAFSFNQLEEQQVKDISKFLVELSRFQRSI